MPSYRIMCYDRETERFVHSIDVPDESVADILAITGCNGSRPGEDALTGGEVCQVASRLRVVVDPGMYDYTLETLP